MDGVALMVMLKLALALAPARSWMVTLPLANVPALVGVPVKLMVVPLTKALSPVGRSLWLVIVNGLVPSLIVAALMKPAWLTVHWLSDSVPTVGAALMMIE